MTALDALRSAVVDAGRADDDERRRAAVVGVDADALAAELVPRAAGGDAVLLATGVAASPGVAVGRAWLDAERAVDAVEAGGVAVLVVRETTPADEWALRQVAGVVTTSGGVASHAAVVARGLGLPAVCGAPLELGPGVLRSADGVEVAEGAVLSIDGSTGEVRVGDVGVVDDAPPPELAVLLGWADEVRRGGDGSGVAVLANVDDPSAARAARAAGAEGVGLCRTEHQLLGEHLGLVRRLLLGGPDAAADALAGLEHVHRREVAGVLEAMDGLPVAIRLLDAPLHEFLPPTEDLAVQAALGELDVAGRDQLAARRRWAEHNPMLGARGARLGVLRRDLYRAQARAVAGAVADRRAAGGDPQARVLVPLVMSAAELALLAADVRQEVAAVLGPDEVVPVGAMIETPRAALVAGELAGVADLLSIGTNDLTQLTLGLSRDDVAALVARYCHDGLLEDDPFAHLDVGGVGRLVELAVAGARAVHPDLPISACGEHAGDPRSVARLVAAGVDAVSCAVTRVPVARLAAAQAVAARS